MKVSVEEAALAAQLCELAETSYDEASAMTPGSAEEAEFQERVVRATELGDSLTRLCGGYAEPLQSFASVGGRAMRGSPSRSEWRIFSIQNSD